MPKHAAAKRAKRAMATYQQKSQKGEFFLFYFIYLLMSTNYLQGPLLPFPTSPIAPAPMFLLFLPPWQRKVSSPPLLLNYTNYLFYLQILLLPPPPPSTPSLQYHLRRPRPPRLPRPFRLLHLPPSAHHPSLPRSSDSDSWRREWPLLRGGSLFLRLGRRGQPLLLCRGRAGRELELKLQQRGRL